MYNKIKTCLLFPRNITDYIDEPGKKTFGFFMFLLILAVIPICVVMIISKSPSENITLNISNGQEMFEQIDCDIVNGKLEAIGIPNKQYVNGTLSVENYIDTSCVYIFNPVDEDKNIMLSSTIIESMGLYCYFYHDGLQIGYLSYGYENDEPRTTYISLKDYTYEELNVETLKFSKNDDIVQFNYEVDILIDNIYQKLKLSFLPLIILFIIPSTAISILFDILISAVIVLIFSGKMGIGFKKIFKTGILCALPEVICMIVSSLTGISFIETIGSLVSFFYLNRAIFAYRLLRGADGDNSDVDNNIKNNNPEVKIMRGVYVHKEEQNQA